MAMLRVPGILVCVTAMLAGCATSVADIESWGHAGRYERIRNELRSNHDEAIRVACANQLARGSYTWAIPDLIALSQDPSSEVRLASVEALGAFAGREVYSAILQRCGDENRAVAAAAERILKTWGSESVEVLLESLADRSFRVRASAAQVLGRMQDGRIGPALAEVAARDENSMVRREAVKSLGTLGYAGAKPVLYQVKHADESSEVCLEAEAALRRLGGKVFEVKLLVSPVCGGDAGAGKLCGRLVQALEGALVQGSVCDIVPAPPGFKGGTTALAAASQLGAQQVVTVTLSREDNRVTAAVKRMDAGSGVLLQQESVPGIEGDPERLERDVVSTFLRRFR